jgi:transposase
VGEITTIGLDIAKSVFQAHGADASGSVLFRKKLPRSRLLAFFASLPPCVVAMEACAGAHHWRQELIRLGHTVRLIPPAYVKPYLKRQKNDMADAEAICEAAQRPTMRFVPVKSEDQQASGVVFRARDLLVRQRTQIINAPRGHMAEYGWVAAKGVAHVQRLVACIEDPAQELPEGARASLQVMVQTLRALDDQIVVLDREIARRAKEDPVARRHPRHWSCHRSGYRSAGSAAGDLPMRPGLRSLAGANAQAALQRRQGEARADHQDG